LELLKTVETAKLSIAGILNAFSHVLDSLVKTVKTIYSLGLDNSVVDKEDLLNHRTVL
jgi:hypothetical protein